MLMIKEYTSVNTIMETWQQDEKDISKVFAFLQAQLRAKEKELLELQRKDPSLLAPDSDQIDILLDTIASLQLSTQDGSFVFASSSTDDDASSFTSVCSTDFNSIKALPSTIWLSQSRPMKQQNQQRSSIFSYLLSLPIDAYLPSSFKTIAKKQNHRIPIVNHLLFMPIDAFKSKSNSSSSIEIKNSKNLQSNVVPSTGAIKSVLNSEMIYSKEYWLRNNQNATSVL